MGVETDYYAGLMNDIEFGKYRVPSLDQYGERAQELREQGLPESIVATEGQRDWHARGQNGCNFARIAARRALEVGWRSEFIASVDDTDRVDNVMRSSEADPDTEIVSLVFDPMPADELVDTIVILTEVSSFYLEKDALIDDGSNRQLFLRYPLQLGKIAAWSMCFAPYEFMPNTRRSPFVEIATRVKEKPEGLHPMLNGNPEEAHLADLILDTDPKHTAHRIITTVGRTATILGGEPNHITAAKSTLVVPVGEV
jgi:hypothetical protein